MCDRLQRHASIFASICLSVQVSIVRVCVIVCLCGGLQAKVTVMAWRGTTVGSCTPWISVLLSRRRWAGVRWAGVRQEGGCVAREKGGRDR